MQKRVAVWDNLKLFLIFLVVLGHMTIQYFSSSRMFAVMTMAVYAFHMPAFIFISGLFSKRAINSDKPPVKKAFGFIMLYFAVRIVTVFSNIIFGVHISFNIFSVQDVPWYMVSMALWYVITWALRKIDVKYVLITSIVISCFAGYMKGDADFLTILRLITFYPFFYAGYVIEPELADSFTRKRSCRIFSGIYFVLFIVCVTVFFDKLEPFFPLLTGRRKFSAIEGCGDWGALLRLAYYVIAGLLVFAVISLCPRGELRISEYGSKTLQIYVYHRGILYIMKNAGLFYLIRLVGAGWEWIALIIPVAVTALLCMNFWGIPINFLLKPKERKEYEPAK